MLSLFYTNSIVINIAQVPYLAQDDTLNKMLKHTPCFKALTSEIRLTL